MFWGTATGITSSNPAITSISTNSYTHTGRDNGTSYYYKVAAVNSAGTGTLSSEVNAATPLSAPANLSATSAFQQVSLAWDNVSGATSYTLYWDNSTGVSSSSTDNTSVSTNSYTHSSLSGGATYYYKVAAVNSSGTGTITSEVNATAGATQLMGGSMQGTALNLTPTVTILAGSAGNAGTVDDNGTAAEFDRPFGITTDGTNLYVTDFTSGKIRQVVISTGVVSTLAGSGFSQPWAITTDGTNLYVADSGNNLIRKIVISTGVVTTLAGAGGTGACVDNDNGSLAKFSKPQGITTDGTNLYVADRSCQLIRKIVISTGAVTTLAGSGIKGDDDNETGTLAKFDGPAGITTDGNNLYVTQVGDGKHSIRKIVISTGVVTTLAGGSVGTTDATGTAAKFSSPYGITTDGTNLYVMDYGNNRIRMIVIDNASVSTLAGSDSGPAVDNTTGALAKFNSPFAITTDGTYLYVPDSYNHVIRKIQ